jgi:hypothetical protein
LTLALTYAVIVAVLIARHPLWLDEADAWCVARDAHSLRDLFWNMRYDGHPSAWYLCLYLLTRLTTHPAAMQVFHIAIAVATVSLIAWRSPFTTWERWGLAFGYLFAFEFAVISRGYALGVLLLFASCHWWSRINERVWLIALALVGLANTSIYGTMLALCLLGALAHDLFGRCPSKQVARGTFLVAAGLVVAGCVVAVVTINPPPDYAFARQWHTRLTAERLADTANLIWFGLAPLPDFSAAAPWNTSVFPTHKAQPIVSDGLAIAAAAMMLIVVWSFRAVRIARDFFLSSTVGLLVFMYLKYSAGPRHCGHLFVILVAGVWLARNRAPDRANDVADRLLWSTAVVQVVAAAFFMATSLSVPFSWSQALTAAIRRLEPAVPVVVADVTLVNYVGPVLSAYVRHPIDFVGPGRMRRGSFIILDEAHHPEAPASRVRPTLESYAIAHHVRDVYVVTSQWSDAEALGPAVATFRTHMVGVEGVATVRAVHVETDQAGVTGKSFSGSGSNE